MSKPATVKIQLCGNQSIFPDGQPGITVVNGRHLIEVEEHSLPGIGGLERHFGLGAFYDGLNAGKISSGDRIRVYHGNVHPDWVEYGFTDYRVFDGTSIDGGLKGPHSPARTLQGTQWYHVVNEKARSGR